jgi:hypothetical protein
MCQEKLVQEGVAELNGGDELLNPWSD